MTSEPLSHIDSHGKASMVDVGAKPITERTAIAEGVVRINAALEEAIRRNDLAKGDLLAVARLAGIQAAKRTDELIPLCHSLPLDVVHVEATLEAGLVRIRATAKTHSRTGVEMEALTAVSVAALTVIDMGKAIDRSMVIEGIRVLEKHGGRSGSHVAPEARSS
jgi:cyclic pyranopterin phosphate synthase